MVEADLFVTRKDGPLSSIFPVHVTSMARAVPLASHGLLNVPSPDDPFGHSTGGAFALAAALGAGALAAGVAEGVGAGRGAADALCAAAVGLLSSFEHPRYVEAKAVSQT